MLLVSGPLPIVNFRYRGSRRLSEKALNRLNESLVSEIQKRGIAIPSLYAIGGKSCVRVCNLNQRSQRSDFEALVQACERLGVELEARTGHQAVQYGKIRRVAARRRWGPDRSEGAQIIKQGRLLRRLPDESQNRAQTEL
jgi:hypothetical protein